MLDIVDGWRSGGGTPKRGKRTAVWADCQPDGMIGCSARDTRGIRGRYVPVTHGRLRRSRCDLVDSQPSQLPAEWFIIAMSIRQGLGAKVLTHRQDWESWSSMLKAIKRLWSRVTGPGRSRSQANGAAIRAENRNALFVEEDTPRELLISQEARKDCLPVSRHALCNEGIVCPRCGIRVAKPGQWNLIHEVERQADGSIWGEEGVCCTECNAFLLASPDDDIDPVKEGEPYDESVYHRFVRPSDWKPVAQKVFNKKPVDGDWVAVRPGIEMKIDGVMMSMDKAEGRVRSIDGDIAKVELAGFSGMSRTELVDIDIHLIRPMVFESFVPGCSVRIISGKHEGRTGTLKSFNLGTIEVKLDDTTIVRIPQERLERLYDEPVVYNH